LLDFGLLQKAMAMLIWFWLKPCGVYGHLPKCNTFPGACVEKHQGCMRQIDLYHTSMGNIVQLPSRTLLQYSSW
jgi:hypothetical protein